MRQVRTPLRSGFPSRSQRRLPDLPALRWTNASLTYTLLSAAGLLALLSPSIVCQGRSQQHAALPSAIEAYASQHGFNGTVLVAKQGKTIYEHSFGLADRSFLIPATNDLRYRIASVTKAFTAVIVLQLYEEGKIDLQGRLQNYLPDFQGEGGNQITIQSLLNHTSGLPQIDVAKTYEDELRLGLPMYETLQSPETMIAKYCTGKLTHPVGTVFEYNNCDYIVLGQIIARVTGKSYDEVLQERILTPLGMSDSGINYRKNIIRKLVPSYFRPTPSQPFENDDPLYDENTSAAAAMYSTAEDLLKFSNAIFGNRLLKPASLELMLTPGLDQYGDGVWVRTFGSKKMRSVERYGRASGMNTLLACLPHEGLTVILFTNTDETNLGEFYGQIVHQMTD